MYPKPGRQSKIRPPRRVSLTFVGPWSSCLPFSAFCHARLTHVPISSVFDMPYF